MVREGIEDRAEVIPVEPPGEAQALLYVEAATPRPAMHAVAGGAAAVYSAPRPGGGAEANEDGALLVALSRDTAVLAVADGLGGNRAGGAAAALALRTLRGTLPEPENGFEPGHLRDAILDGIERANAAVREGGVGAATTLAVVEIQGTTMRPYHVGDSTILVFGQRGRMKLHTVAHSPVGFAVEAGLLGEEEAMHHKERHLVSNMIGTTDMRIEMGSALRLAARDTLLIASDGLLDNLAVEEIVACLRKGPLDRASEELARRTRARMTAPAPGDPSKPDDLTFVAFRRASVPRKVPVAGPTPPQKG